MNILSIILIGLSTNLDNLCAAAAIGMSGKRIAFAHNVIISLISGVVAFVAGQAAAFLFACSFASLLGGLMIAGMGVWTVAGAFTENVNESMRTQEISMPRMLLLGCALAINCLPVAFGAGALGLSPCWVGIFIALFSFCSIALGIAIGHKIGRKLHTVWINVLSGVLLIVLGLIGAFC